MYACCRSPAAKRLFPKRLRSSDVGAPTTNPLDGSPQAKVPTPISLATSKGLASGSLNEPKEDTESPEKDGGWALKLEARRVAQPRKMNRAQIIGKRQT